MSQSIESRRAKLEERRLALQGRIQEAVADLSETPSQDWEDRATDLEDDEVQETMVGTDSHEIAAIDAALVRIKEGTYGDCVRCGDPIEEARLDLLPHTPFCAKCAKKVSK